MDSASIATVTRVDNVESKMDDKFSLLDLRFETRFSSLNYELILNAIETINNKISNGKIREMVSRLIEKISMQEKKIEQLEQEVKKYKNLASRIEIIEKLIQENSSLRSEKLGEERGSESEFGFEQICSSAELN